MKTNFTAFIDFQEFYILLYTYSLDQAKNVFHVTESWHQVLLDFWYLLSAPEFGIEGDGGAGKHRGRAVLKTSHKNIGEVHNKLED